MKKLYKKDRLFTLGRWLLLALCLGLALAAAGCRKNPADEPLTVTEAFPANGAVEVPEDAAIEMTFSVPPEKLDNYFVIQPELKGRFHYMGNTVAFIPFRGWDQESETWSDGLRYDTQYTITIQAGLGAEGGKGKLQEDFSFSFTVCPDGTAAYTMTNKAETFLPQDYPVLDLRFNTWGKEGVSPEESFAVAVHRLEDGERYKKELHRKITLPGELRVDTAGLPQVLADRERVIQVMMNIVSNAIKYTPDGGNIAIRAGRERNRVWMVVDDDGIGIPEEDRPRIFERFYRVDKARSRQSGGTGLGLSIAKEIVDRHRGRLAILDKDGPGLAVRLDLYIEGPEHG